MVEIRKANMFDHTAVLKLLIEWFEESQVINGYDKSASCWLSNLINSENSVVFLAEHEGKVIGSIGIRKTLMPWNSQSWFLVSDFIMTDKEHRSIGVAEKLMKASKDLSDSEGIPLLIGHMTGTHAELKDKFLQMKGFTYLGGNLSYFNQGE